MKITKNLRRKHTPPIYDTVSVFAKTKLIMVLDRGFYLEQVDSVDQSTDFDTISRITPSAVMLGKIVDVRFLDNLDDVEFVKAKEKVLDVYMLFRCKNRRDENGVLCMEFSSTETDRILTLTSVGTRKSMRLYKKALEIVQGEEECRELTCGEIAAVVDPKLIRISNKWWLLK